MPNSERQRTVAARFGVTALNLLFPGLGLVRIGRWKSGLCCGGALFALIGLTTLGFDFGLISYTAVVVAATLAILACVAIFVLPMALTWRHGKVREPLRWWSRWYAIVALCMIADLLLNQAADLSRRVYKPFYAPSRSMEPTILEGDKFVADMGWHGPFERGMPILFQGPGSVRIYRIAAVAGDRVAIGNGVPIINGVAAQWQPRGVQAVDGAGDGRLWSERLPGEARPHLILKSEPTPFDDLPEMTVPKGHFFVLGDNRDRSADSRVPTEALGVGMVPEDAVIGRPWSIYWSRVHDRIGRRLD